MKTKPSLYPPYLTSRLRWLMLSRLMIVTFLLGIATFIQIKQMESLSAISASFLFKAIILTYLLSIFYLFLLRSLPSITFNIYTQAMADVALITAVVYATGGIHSIYSVFYPLVIIYSVLFLGRKGGLIIASAASIMYGLFADLEFYGVIYPLFSIPSPDFPRNGEYVFTRIITHILSFYFIAFLASFVVEQERKARRLLDQKQTDFEQLDLLHRSIIESIDTGILTVNLDQRIKSFNRAAAEITGLSFREVVNRSFSEVFSEGPDLADKRAAIGNTWIGKTRFEMPFPAGGRTLILGGSVSPLRDQTGQTIGNIVIFQDLTEINVMRETIEKSRRLAYAGEMAACLAHEIRNPLASISGSLQMLKEEVDLNDTSRRLLQIVFRGKDQLENFLKDFLLMARPAPGSKEKVQLDDLLKEVFDSLRCTEDWQGGGIQEETLFPAGPLFIEANKTEVRQIFWNLLLNAIQAMPEGGRLKVTVHPVRSEEREGVEIRIEDTGFGIEKEGLKMMFEPFYTTRDKGTGLGLPVVNRIVETYGGKILIQSEAGKGTCCTIWLPLRAESQAGA